MLVRCLEGAWRKIMGVQGYDCEVVLGEFNREEELVAVEEGEEIYFRLVTLRF